MFEDAEIRERDLSRYLQSGRRMLTAVGGKIVSVHLDDDVMLHIQSPDDALAILRAVAEHAEPEDLGVLLETLLTEGLVSIETVMLAGAANKSTLQLVADARRTEGHPMAAAKVPKEETGPPPVYY